MATEMTTEQALEQIKRSIRVNKETLARDREEFSRTSLLLHAQRRRLMAELQQEKQIERILTLCRTGK